MKNFFLYSFLCSCYLFSFENLKFQDSLFLNRYQDNSILLKLEPFNIATFVLDKYYPNSFVDYHVGSYRIDGSMRLPIYQSIPEKLFFDEDSIGTYTQLSYKQKKSDLFFDTRIAFKTDINDFTSIILKAESKSIYSNINQNYHLSINKKNGNDNISFDYMYHIEGDPSIDFFEDINFNIESFHGGYSYFHDGQNFIFKSNSSIQFSNNNRFQNYDYIYDYQAIWIDNDIFIPINNYLNIAFSQSYKKHVIEHSYSSLNNYNNNKDLSSINLNFYLKRYFDLLIGYDFYINQGSPSITLKYYKNNFILSLNSNNDIIEELVNLTELNMKYRSIKNSYFNLSYNDMDIRYYSITYGQIYSDSFQDDFNDNYYYYYHFNGKLKTEKFLGQFNYYNYSDTEILTLNAFSSFEFIYMPMMENKRFRPYGKIFGNHYSFNKDKELNLNNILFYDNVNSVNDFMKNINLFNLEFGFIFDSFKISYIKLNPNVEELEISNNIKFISYDYISLVWFFKD